MPTPPVEVQDNSHRKVRAKMLVDAADRNVRDPMTGAPLIVDEDFDVNHAIAFGRALKAMVDTSDDPTTARAALYAAMYSAFHEGGHLDMQRSYNGMVGGGGSEFVGAFRPAASYLLGVVGRAAGLNPEDIIAGGGFYNRYRKSGPLNPNPNLNTSGPSGNAPTNVRWIEEGIRAYDSGRFSKPSSGNPGGTNQTPQNQTDPAEDSILDGQPPPRQEQPPMPMFADLIPKPAGPQLKTAGEAPAYQQVSLTGAVPACRST